jgi:hypothetical protein
MKTTDMPTKLNILHQRKLVRRLDTITGQLDELNIRRKLICQQLEKDPNCVVDANQKLKVIEQEVSRIERTIQTLNAYK